MSDPAPQPDLPQLTCPSCGQVLSLADAKDGMVTRPGCGQPARIGPEESVETNPIQDDQPVEPIGEPDEADLSALRIHQISAMRRGAYRTRSWLLIAAVACAAGAAQLIYLAIRGYHFGQRMVPAGDLIAAVAALIAFPYFVRRAVRVNRDIRQSQLDEPQTPPDFSTLSDGSQRWKNLEAMTEDPGDC